MTVISRSILSAVLLLSVPATGAFAQSGDSVGMSSGHGVQTAWLGGTNDFREFGIYTWKPGMGPAYLDPFFPGATGRTIVLGSHDTIAGDWGATEGTRFTSVCC
jgi:hypothetical protein